MAPAPEAPPSNQPAGQPASPVEAADELPVEDTAPPAPPVEAPPAVLLEEQTVILKKEDFFKEVSFSLANGTVRVSLNQPATKDTYVNIMAPQGLELDYRGSIEPGLTERYIKARAALTLPGSAHVIVFEGAPRWDEMPQRVELLVELPEIDLRAKYNPKLQQVHVSGSVLEKWQALVGPQVELTADPYDWGSSLAVSPTKQFTAAQELQATFDVGFDRLMGRAGTVTLYARHTDKVGWWHSASIDVPVHLPIIIRDDRYNNTTRELTVQIDNSTDSFRTRDVTVECTLPDGAVLPAQVLPGGFGEAVFPLPDLGMDDYFVKLHAWDTAGYHNRLTTYAGGWVGALPADTLVAVPLQTSVSTGESVRIVVAMGRTASPFQYMTGVRVTVDSAAGMSYVPGSFDTGRVGGVLGVPDGGVWERMGNDGFLVAPDFFIMSSEAHDGRVGYDFNVTPVHNGRDMRSGGELFNFEARFANPGTYQLGFEEQNTVNRTYYQDGNQAPDFHWGNISNEVEGLANTIQVN